MGNDVPTGTAKRQTYSNSYLSKPQKEEIDSNGFHSNDNNLKAEKSDDLLSSVMFTGKKDQSSSGTGNFYGAEGSVFDDTHEKYIVHKLEGNENLQGLALKYGVDKTALKKLNKIWNDNDMFTKASLVIPTTPEKYEQYQRDQQSEKQNQNQKTNETHSQLIRQFLENTKTDSEATAKYYLEQRSWNLNAALGAYFTAHPQKKGENEQFNFVNVTDYSGALTEESVQSKYSLSDSQQKKLEHDDDLLFEL